MSYANKIEPFVRSELECAKTLYAKGDAVGAFSHLETVHVLGQRSTKWHTIAHCQMLWWALRQRNLREGAEQVIRIVGALTKTFVGLVPTGNTGGANVNPFKPMPISSEHARIIERASS